MILIIIIIVFILAILITPIHIKISMDSIGVRIYVYNFKVKYFNFNEVKEIEEEIIHSKTKIEIKDLLELKKAFTLKDINVKMGFLNEDFEVMMTIQTIYYIIIPAFINYFKQNKILYSFILTEEEVKKSSFECIISFNLRKVIMQLIKILRRRRNKHVTSNT